MIHEYASFFREFQENFQTTGSLLPSGRFLARAMTSELRKKFRPARVLEVGPGTGALTQEIVRYLDPRDELDLVELNPKFVEVLRRRVAREERFLDLRERIRIIAGPVQSLANSESYDYIISALPLNNFPPGVVKDIFQAFSDLLRPGGTLSYFEYLLIRQLKVPFSDRRERRRLDRLNRVMLRYIRDYRFRRQSVILNLPPAVVHHLKLRAPAAVPCL